MFKQIFVVVPLVRKQRQDADPEASSRKRRLDEAEPCQTEADPC